MALRHLLKRSVTVAVGVVEARGSIAPAVALRCYSTSRVTCGPKDFPFDAPFTTPTALEDGAENLDPPGTPWTPTPVAEDYEETINILLNSRKVEDALDIFARMVKRGFRPSSEIVDELYAAAKTKPEWQAAAVKAINGMDLSVFK